MASADEFDSAIGCAYYAIDAPVRQVSIISVTGISAPPASIAEFSAGLHRQLEGSCETLTSAEAVVQALAVGAGLESDAVQVHTAVDPDAACTRAAVNVTGVIRVVLRGPAS